MINNTTVEVLVIDTNDNPPVFTKPVYNAPVPENAFGGFQVLTRKTVFHRDVQTPRRELKTRRAAEYF